MKGVLDLNGPKRVKNILLVTVGTLILSFGTAIFIIPLGIVLGGVSGLAIALAREGGVGTIHKNMSIETQADRKSVV